MQKTLQSLLGEIKTVDKRIEREILELTKSTITDIEKPTFGFDNGKFSKETAGKFMQAKYQSVRSLIERLKALRTIRDEMNMKTKLTVNDQTFTIYEAIMFRDILSKKLSKMYQVVVLSNDEAETRATGTSRSSREAGRGAQNGIELIPLLDVNKIKEEFKNFDKTIQDLDSALTVANSTTQVEY